jgi:hypothetical protein
MHDQTKVLMGSTGSSYKEVTNYPGAATLEAGLVAHAKSDGTVTKAKADGSPVGVSMGKDLASTTRSVVCRKGLRVPLKLKAGFTPTIGAAVEIDDAEGYGTGDGTKTAVNAVYCEPYPGAANALVSATGGIAEGATDDTGTVRVALIDFPGGL